MATLADLMIRIGIDSDRVKKGAGKVVSGLDKSFRRLDSIAGTAIKTMGGLSGVAPLAAGAAGGVIALGATFAAAGAAGGAFGAVLATTVKDVSENATKYEDLTEKIRLYGRQAEEAGKFGLEAGAFEAKRTKALSELSARLSLLPPAERAATMEFINMKNSWSDFVDDNKPQTFSILTRGYSLIGKVVQGLQPLYDIGAKAAGRLMDRMHRLVDGGFMERLAARAGPAMDSLVNIILNLGTVFGKVFGKMGDAQGQKMLDWIEQMTAKWAAWANSTEKDTGINKFVEYMTTNGPRVVELLGNLATAAVNIAKAVSPLAPVTVAVATALSGLVAAIPPEWITAIVTGFVAYNIALKAYAIYQGVATAATWAMNAAWLASPITWIVLAIVALIAIIVLVATKTKFFQNVWNAVWSFLKRVGAWFAGPFADFFVRLWQKITQAFNKIKADVTSRINAVKTILTVLYNHARSQFDKVINKGKDLVSWFRALPGRVKGALSNIFSPLWSSFKGAVNRVIAGWNNLSFTIGGGSVFGVDIPSVTVSTPNIPYLASGALVTGPTLAMIGEGREDEVVAPLSKVPDLVGRDDERPVVVQIMPGGEREFRRWINKTVRVKGALRTQGA